MFKNDGNKVIAPIPALVNTALLRKSLCDTA